MSVGLVALATNLSGQWCLAFSRRNLSWFGKLVDNGPLLLAGSTIIEENLDRANVTRGDLFGKLQEANAFDYHQVVAVVFETTGDISVLHSDCANVKLDADFVQNVVGAEEYLTKN